MSSARCGIVLAILPGVNKLDAQPGTLPEIHIGRGGITFAMQPRGIHHGKLLVIRCDTNGDVWMALASADESEHQISD